VLFAKQYEENDNSIKLVEIANSIEGLLMTEQVLSVIRQDEAQSLIDELHDLVENRNSQNTEIG